MLTYADVCLQVSTSGCNIRETPTLHRSALLLLYYCFTGVTTAIFVWILYMLQHT
jgi:hypothetical protein